jgi:hypothetical protein
VEAYFAIVLLIILKPQRVPISGSLRVYIQSLLVKNIKSHKGKYLGEVPEWPNGAVSKTVVPLGTVGSNPTLSASLR